jgi:hypothetical protein
MYYIRDTEILIYNIIHFVEIFQIYIHHYLNILNLLVLF